MLKYIAIVGSWLWNERETGLFCFDMQRMMRKTSPDKEKHQKTSSVVHLLVFLSPRASMHPEGATNMSSANKSRIK